MVKSSYGGQLEADRLRLLQSLERIHREVPEVTEVVVSPRDAALLETAEAYLPTCYNRMPDGICKGHPHSSSPTGVVYHEAKVEENCAHPFTFEARVCLLCSEVLGFSQ